MRVKNFRKLFCEWKEGYLQEGEILPAEEGDVLPFEEINALFKVFHLSAGVLGGDENNRWAQFTPRVPGSPFQDDSGNFIEDDFTKRVSLGPTIEKCIEAIDGYVTANILYAGDIRNYAEDDAEVISTKVMFKSCSDELSSNGNEYGREFNFDSWSEDYIDAHHKELSQDDADQINAADKPSRLPDAERQMFYACIPDAPDTEELWSKEPINLYFLGHISNRVPRVRLSRAGAKVITIAKKHQGRTS